MNDDIELPMGLRRQLLQERFGSWNTLRRERMYKPIPLWAVRRRNSRKDLA